MNIQEDLAYWEQEGLAKYFLVDTSNTESDGANDAIPADINDLVRLHKLIRERKSFTVLEFGVGYSTLIIADALKKNKEDFESLDPVPAIRNRFCFQCFSVDTSEHWIAVAASRVPEELKDIVHFHYSGVEIDTHDGQLCHFYKSLPDIVPDFIYLDGPDPKSVEGTIRGVSFKCDERTVMSGDLIFLEPILLPGTFILIDGRTNNARFLKNNLKREYHFVWDRVGDVTTIELIEERLGKYNILGSDFFE